MLRLIGSEKVNYFLSMRLRFINFYLIQLYHGFTNNYYISGGVKTTVAEDVSELKTEVGKLYKMMRRMIGLIFFLVIKKFHGQIIF